MEAFEGNRDVLKTIKEKAKRFSRFAIKEARKATGLHVGEVTEANPIYYVVVVSQGAMVRRGIELDSPRVHGLSCGDLVTCVALSGRRARIIDPVEGWVSTRTHDNQPILESTVAPDMKVQVSIMEKRFAKLKAEQEKSDQRSVVGRSPIISEAPETEVTNIIKSKLTFKPVDELSSKQSVPKLKGLQMRVSVPRDLLDLNSPKNASVKISETPISCISASSPREQQFSDNARASSPMDPFAGLFPAIQTLSPVSRVLENPSWRIPASTDSSQPTSIQKTSSLNDDWLN